MGTNFYYKIPLKKREIQDLRGSITDDPSLTDLKDLISIYTDHKIIHLGKRSAGWQFLWNYNEGDYYDPNLKSIKEFLISNNGWIENEYGDKFSIEEFFNDEVNSWLYKDKDHWDAISYHQDHPEEPYVTRPEDHEFQSDGLRFSKHVEFS